MKERPILFSAPMVRALLDGSKTQTRRVCKAAVAHGLSHVIGIQDPRDFGQRPLEVPGSGWFGDEEGDVQFFCPYGRPGDRLYVRETFVHIDDDDDKFDGMGSQTYYAASGDYEANTKWLREHGLTWKPSIHMPRATSRILLEVVSVRVEPLQDISEADSMSEGVMSLRNQAWDRLHFPVWRYQFDEACAAGLKPPAGPSPAQAFKALWESINGPGSWDANPWVWVIEFRRVLP